MIKPRFARWASCAAAALCLLIVAGCGAIAKAPPSNNVCHIGNNKIDRTIVRESDCYQTGGTWDEGPN